MKLTAIIMAGAALFAASAAHAQDITGDAEAGEKVFKKCKACHVADEEKNKVGPHLRDVIGRTPGTVDGFKYSAVMKDFGAGGAVWDVATLSAYLADPKGTVKGTKMAFAGLKTPEDIADVIAYLDHESSQ